ncbi:hypothetical protein Tsp_03104 [Trichinella spiralis]|uniref:hypothetical protein n=1 Tax=Trichinella spiralis TaxID=6334 RepID=UPI0001EFB9DE|nr:hypothetical protein Tsp_03104 [Trichinella spiralis]
MATRNLIAPTNCTIIACKNCYNGLHCTMAYKIEHKEIIIRLIHDYYYYCYYWPLAYFGRGRLNEFGNTVLLKGVVLCFWERNSVWWRWSAVTPNNDESLEARCFLVAVAGVVVAVVVIAGAGAAAAARRSCTCITSPQLQFSAHNSLISLIHLFITAFCLFYYMYFFSKFKTTKVNEPTTNKHRTASADRMIFHNCTTIAFPLLTNCAHLCLLFWYGTTRVTPPITTFKSLNSVNSWRAAHLCGYSTTGCIL